MKSRTPSLIALAVVPVAIVGGALWLLVGLVPDCSTTILSTANSPDARKALVVLARDCGPGSLNTQAVIMTAGGTLEGDAEGFLALEGQHDLPSRWDAYGNLEVTLPAGARVVQQQDEAAGISIIYN